MSSYKKSSKAAKRYAKAFFSLAKEHQLDAQAENEISNIKNLAAASIEFRQLIHSPILPAAGQEAILAKVLSKMKVSELTLNFCKLLCRNRRINLLLEIINEYIKISSEARNEILAEVITASSINEKQQAQIISRLESLLSKKVKLSIIEDSTILGGLIIKLGSNLIDCSLKSKIDNIKLLSQNKIALS
jgi:F-type H+-transporting ATPase subunit delta